MSGAGSNGGAHASAPPDATNLASRIAELAKLPVEEMRMAWSAAWGAPPPKGARRRFLMLGIAWKWQVRIHGGFSGPLETRLVALEAGCRQGRGIDRDALSRNRRLPPGTRLVRDWRGTRHEVHVIENGFLWQGKRHSSLSAIATAISGARRNGPAFFGLREARGTS